VVKKQRDRLLLRGFGNVVLSYWRFYVGHKMNRPCERAIDQALEDFDKVRNTKGWPKGTV